MLEPLSRLGGAVSAVALTADPGTPIMEAADSVVVPDFVDEESVVQTRLATSVPALLRGHPESAGPLPSGTHPPSRAIRDASPVPCLPGRGTGGGRTAGSAAVRRRAVDLPRRRLDVRGPAPEAGLKTREAAGAWTEAYPAMAYRHGPISIAAPGRVTWMFGTAPHGLADGVTRAGGTFAGAETAEGRDPMADPILAQRLSPGRVAWTRTAPAT